MSCLWVQRPKTVIRNVKTVEARMCVTQLAMSPSSTIFNIQPLLDIELSYHQLLCNRIELPLYILHLFDYQRKSISVMFPSLCNI